ncbi:MAG TPA: DUF4129 domain-containing protein [Thermoplasmata archaeon]|nr:DUF4129 domain-containing protein [Thermoplasmata archaeon]
MSAGPSTSVRETAPAGRSRPGRAGRAPPWGPLPVALVPLAAVLVGVAAVLLAGPNLPTAAAPAGAPHLPSFALLTTQEVALGVVAAFFGWLAWWIGSRIARRTVPIPSSMVAAGISFLLALLLIAVLLQVVGAHQHSEPLPTTNGTPPATNSSSPGVNWSFQTPVLSAPGLPSWLPYFVVVVIAAAAAFVAVPLAVGLVRTRHSEPEGNPEVRSAAESAIRRALAEMRAAPSSDPRAIVIRLYAQLLSEVGERAGAIDPMTPREIMAGLVGKLGVGSATAQELTELFEEARYSRRPMGPETSARARDALDRALVDLSAPRRLP